jgi:hypothetical protein
MVLFCSVAKLKRDREFCDGCSFNGNPGDADTTHNWPCRGRKIHLELGGKRTAHRCWASPCGNRNGRTRSEFPLPSASELQELRPGMTDISEVNLATIWGNYRALGCDRLILSGVMVFLDEARKWIGRAIPNADFTVVRLLASNDALLRRLEKREIGSGIEDQVRRTLRQANEIATLGSAGVIELQTDGKAPQELASELLDQIGWLANRQ